MIIFILLVFLGMFYPKSKGITIINAVYIFMVLALNTVSADIGQYEYVYENLFSLGLQWHYEPAYSLLMILCKTIGLNFRAFRVIWAFIILIFIELTIYRFTENTAMASSLYILCTLPMLVSGMRMAISVTLAVYGVSFLLEEKQNKKAMLFILLSVLFHYSSIFYLLLLFGEKRSVKMGNKRIFIVLFITFVSSYIIVHTKILLNVLKIFTHREKTLSWFTGNISRPNALGFSIATLVLIVDYLICTKGLKTARKAHKGYSQMQLACHVSTIMLLLIPFLTIHDTFMRIEAGIFPVTLFAYCELVSAKRRHVSEYIMVSANSAFIYTWGFISLLYKGYTYWRGSGMFILKGFNISMLNIICRYK